MELSKFLSLSCMTGILILSGSAQAQAEIPGVSDHRKTSTLGNAPRVSSPTDGLGTPVPVIGRGSTMQADGKTQGELDGRRFTARFVGSSDNKNAYVVIVWRDTGDEEVVDYDTYENLYEPYTEEGEAKRQVEEAERQRKEAEEEARKAAEEDADSDSDDSDCDNDEEDCTSPSTRDETSVAGDDEPSGEGATSDDTVLTNNGGDTTGGINQGDEPSDGAGVPRQIIGSGTRIQDFPGSKSINVESLRSLDVIKDSTGGGPVIADGVD